MIETKKKWKCDAKSKKTSTFFDCSLVFVWLTYVYHLMLLKMYEIYDYIWIFLNIQWINISNWDIKWLRLFINNRKAMLSKNDFQYYSWYNRYLNAKWCIINERIKFDKLMQYHIIISFHEKIVHASEKQNFHAVFQTCAFIDFKEMRHWLWRN